MKPRDGTSLSGHPVPKHVWVNDDLPGVLLGWRVVESGKWEAHVVWAHDGGAELGWLSADLVRPRT